MDETAFFHAKQAQSPFTVNIMYLQLSVMFIDMFGLSKYSVKCLILVNISVLKSFNFKNHLWLDKNYEYFIVSFNVVGFSHDKIRTRS